MRSLVLLFVLVFLIMPNASQAGIDVTVFSCDFENGLNGVVSNGVSAEFSNITLLEATQGYSNYVFGEKFLFNGTFDTTKLTLENLPLHSGITVQYHLAIINSWDGSEAAWGPDYFNVNIDDVSVFYESISQVTMGKPMSFNPLPSQILFEGENQYSGPGSEHAGTPDSGYLMPIEFYQHNSSSVEIEWFANGSGYQGFYYTIANDEAWAIDNISVVLHDVQPIPAPGAIFLGIMGVSFTGWLKRRKSL